MSKALLDGLKEALASVFGKLSTQLSVQIGTVEQRQRAIDEYCPRVLLDLEGRPEVGVLIDLPVWRDAEPPGMAVLPQPWIPVYIGPGLSAQGAAADWLRLGNRHPLSQASFDPSSSQIWVTVSNGKCVAAPLMVMPGFWEGAANEARYLRALDVVVQRSISLAELAERSLRIQKRIAADFEKEQNRVLRAKLMRLRDRQGELELKRGRAIEAYRRAARCARTANDLQVMATIFQIAAAVAGSAQNAQEAQALERTSWLEMEQLNVEIFSNETTIRYEYRFLRLDFPYQPYLYKSERLDIGPWLF
jgi:hypothetical protein